MLEDWCGNAKAAGRERAPFTGVTVKRELRATIDRAFDAWTDARLVARWLVPRDRPASFVSVNPREGGHYCIEGDGFTIRGTFLVVERPDKLVMSWVYDGLDSPVGAEESVVIVTFTARGAGKTVLTVVHERNICEWADAGSAATTGMSSSLRPKQGRRRRHE